LTSARDVRITKQDVNHVLTILRNSYIVSKNRRRGGLLVLLPRLFFELSYRYGHAAPNTDPSSFILKQLSARGVPWCFNDLMSFVRSYGDLVAEFFALIDHVYSKHETSFRAATLLLISTTTVPEPYSWVIPSMRSSLFERLKLLERGLSKVYGSIKARIASLTSSYENTVYINARNIATAILFYILLSEGVKRVLHYHGSDKPDPHLSLLFTLDEKYIKQYYSWEKQLIGKQRKRLNPAN
jgi:hypothetical protein